MSSALPNESHRILSDYQRKRKAKLITQNVDGLHRRSGSIDIEMHGSLRTVSCVSCTYKTERDLYQQWLQEINPVVHEWAIKHPEKIMGDVSSSVNPDGDVEISWNYDEFKYPSCPKCNGVMKPDVVFFGENIPDVVKQETFRAVDQADCLVAIGTSLTVYSAYRLVRRAHDQKKPIVVLNLGPTRADDLAEIKYDEPILGRLKDLYSH